MSDSEFLNTTSKLERLCRRVDEAHDGDSALAALDLVSAYLTNPSDEAAGKTEDALLRAGWHGGQPRTKGGRRDERHLLTGDIH